MALLTALILTTSPSASLSLDNSVAAEIVTGLFWLVVAVSSAATGSSLKVLASKLKLKRVFRLLLHRGWGLRLSADY